MAAVEKLCSRAILLSQGKVSFAGPTPEVVSRYLEAFDASVLEFVPEAPALPYRIARIRVCDEDGATLSRVTAATALSVEIEVENDRDRSDLKLALLLHDSHQNPIFASSPPDVGSANPTRAGSHRYIISLPGPILRPQRYSLTVSLYTKDPSESQVCWHALSFDVAEVYSPLTKDEVKRTGVLVLPCRWRHDHQGAKTEALVQ
jgi:lipopolysaccharide transport system ATP-binding protein